MFGRKNSGATAAHGHDAGHVEDASDARTRDTSQHRASEDRVDMAKERHEDRPHDTRRDRDTRDRDTHDRDTHDRDVRVERGAAAASGSPLAHRGHVEARDRFGGINWGAGFFGWLVAIGLALLLSGIVGALAAAVGSSLRVSQSAAEREAGTIGVAAAVTLLIVLAIAYFVGGYVAGRMSRFDGGKQGLATWVIGLLVTLVAVGLGAVFGNEYNVLDRIDLPNIALTGEQLSWGAGLTGLVAIVVTLLAAMLGGKVGHRYHDKVDRVAHR